MIDDIRGFAFPFRIDPATGGVAVASGGAKIRENVSIILSTREGERPMLREFGTRIHGLVQEANDAILATLLKEQVRESLLRWESRILITRAEVQQAESEVQLKLAYAHTSEPLAGEMIVPVR